MTLDEVRVLVGSNQFVGRVMDGQETGGDRLVAATLSEAMSAGADGWNAFVVPELVTTIRWFRGMFPTKLLLLSLGANSIEEELATASAIDGPLGLLIHSRIVDCPSVDLLADIVRTLARKTENVVLSTRSPVQLIRKLERLDAVRAVAAPVNCVGYGFDLHNGSISESLEALQRIRSHLPVFAFSAMAAGSLPVATALGFASCFADGAVVGVSNEEQARHTVKEARKLFDHRCFRGDRVRAIEYVQGTEFVLDRGRNPVLVRSRPASWGFQTLQRRCMYPFEAEPAAQPSVAVPQSLFLELTGRCNYACIHCYAGWGDAELNETDASTLIREFAAQGGRTVKFSGGEPLLHPALRQLALLSTTLGLSTTVCTNGSLLDAALLRSFAENDVRVQVSVDSLREDVTDSIRGMGSHRATVRALGLLCEHMPDRWTALTTLMRPNIDRVGETLGRLAGYRPARVAFSIYKPLGPSRPRASELAPSGEQLASLGLELLGAASSLVRPIGAPGELVMRDLLCDVGKPKCSLGSQIRVDPRGMVFPCPQLAKDGWTIGTVWGGVAAALRGARIGELRRHVADRPQRIRECAVCFWKGFCLGGCPARTCAEPGEDLVPDDLCRVRQSLFPRVLTVIARRVGERRAS